MLYLRELVNTRAELTKVKASSFGGFVISLSRSCVTRFAANFEGLFVCTECADPPIITIYGADLPLP